MFRFLKRYINNERGQALPIVLTLLAIGGLTVIPTLNYATTILNSTRVIEDKVKGIYAAGAGVEHAFWRLGHGGCPASYNMTENINQMAVSITKEDKGAKVLYFGGFANPGDAAADLSINGTISLVGGNQYQYTFTVTFGRLMPIPSMTQ